MNDINVSNLVLDRLSSEWEDLTPEARKAAKYVLENPQEVGISTVREIARAAQVNPNTFVRMAQQVGFDGYEDFRTPFRDAIRAGSAGFPDRARWLQKAAKRGALGELYADMATSALANLEQTLAGISPEDLQNAAQVIWSSRRVFTLGVGVNHANAQNFTYLASTGLREFYTIPRPGATATDDLAFADNRDVLIAMTCSPYRSEVLAAIGIAKEQGLQVIGISDSRASPVIRAADHGFIVGSDTPQFFPSSVSTIALLEMLLSFVIAIADDEIVARVESFHRRRHQLGLYQDDPE